MSRNNGQTGRNGASELDGLMEFEVFCGRAEGKSEKSIALTLLALRKLSRYLHDNGLPQDVRLLSANDIRAFILYLQGCKRFLSHPYVRPQDKPLSGHAINSYLRSLRAAWNRWVAEGLVESSLFKQVKIPRPPRKVTNTFSPEQIEKLFKTIDLSTPTGFRDNLLINLYLDTGCRLSEITNLKMNDVDLQGRIIKVLGKGQKERHVPFGTKVQRLLWKYIRLHRAQPQTPKDDLLLLTADGRPLTKNRVETILKKHATKAGIVGVRCSPHTLRHTACLYWIRNGGDIFSLQQVTGHSSLTVLRGYVNLSQSDIRDAHHKYSPVDNLEMRPIARNRYRQSKNT